jgi:hypothetical protein
MRLLSSADLPKDSRSLLVTDQPSGSVPPTNPSPSAAAPAVPASTANELSKEQLKAAYVAFKKRWKFTKLDEESRIGRGPMSSGQKSTIVGIQPPNQYPTAIWEALVEQGKIKRAGHGQYSMP